MGIVRDLLSKFAAFRRGERRVAPPGMTGRVYARPGDGQMAAKSKRKGSITARVFRAKTGKWEDLGTISKGDQ